MKRDRIAAFLSVGVSLLLGLAVILCLLPDVKKEQVKKPEKKVQVMKQPVETPKPQSIHLPPPPKAKVAKAVSQPKPVKKAPPKPVVKQIPKPVPKPKPIPVAKPSPKSEPKPAPKPEPKAETVKVATAGKKLVQEGRALLRVLEHGAGPVIEIAWPEGRSAREALYQNLAGCYGMKVALMDPTMRLFVADQGRGQAWDFNADRYSGFVRQPSGSLAPNEAREHNVIRNRHGLSYEAHPVRIFPRHLDALLLGGMGRLIGPAYQGSKSIRATYVMKGRRMLVENIMVDGRRVSGTVDFTSRCGV